MWWRRAAEVDEKRNDSASAKEPATIGAFQVVGNILEGGYNGSVLLALVGPSSSLHSGVSAFVWHLYRRRVESGHGPLVDLGGVGPTAAVSNSPMREAAERYSVT